MTRLPIVRDPQFIPRIHRELGPGSARRWEHPGLQSAAQFAWAMTVAAARANGNGGTAGGGTALPAEAVAAVIDDDEAAVDAALDNRSVRVRLDLEADLGFVTQGFCVNKGAHLRSPLLQWGGERKFAP